MALLFNADDIREARASVRDPRDASKDDYIEARFRSYANVYRREYLGTLRDAREVRCVVCDTSDGWQMGRVKPHTCLACRLMTEDERQTYIERKRLEKEHGDVDPEWGEVSP